MKRFLRILKWGGIVLILLILGMAGTSEVIIRWCVAPEPTMKGTPPILKEKVRTVGKRKILGRSWLEKREGIWMLYLEGDPFTMGYSNGRLTYDLLGIQEDEFLGTVVEKIPNALILRMVRTFVAYYNCSLHEHLTQEHKMMLYGLSLGAPRNHGYLGPVYNKYMNYHAAHDISHLIMDTPFVSASGCTGFAAWGDRTAQGHMISGRNFDFETARSFDVHKVVAYMKPDKGIPFVTVGWSGFLGAVSGMNKAGLSISMYAGHASGRGGSGMPISLVARQVLQYAKDLKQATDIICKAKVFVSDSFLIGSQKERTFIVVEKSPAKCAVRKAKDKRILVANHFLSPAFANDPEVKKYKASGTSLARYQRIDTLTKRKHGLIDAAKSAKILRDRRGQGGKDVGLGNRSSLNALIATHSVIFDMDLMRMWVSASPHQLGKFVAFDMHAFDKPLPKTTLPADPLFGKPYKQYKSFRKDLKRVSALLGKKKWKEALVLGKKLEPINPKYYELLDYIGRGYAGSGDVKKAIAYYRKALAAQPAYPSERKQIVRRLRALKGTK